MAKFIKKITVVASDSKETLYKSSKKKRKISRWLRPLERGERRATNALATFSDTLLRRHKRSNRKRRNGWLRDGTLNLVKAERKAFKKLFKF